MEATTRVLFLVRSVELLTMSEGLYIRTAKQISIQQPLSEEWMHHPLHYDGMEFAHAIEANYRDYLSPMETRRMAPIMKRAIATAIETIKQSGIEHPDAIITGTSIGSLDYTERFLDSMIENGEELLKPTYFMQSTHNTVGSMLGIYTKTHSYNTTYSHGELSFDLALQDAFTQLRLGKIRNALVCGNDEIVDSYYELLKKRGYVGIEGMCTCGEVSVAMILDREPSDESLCRLESINIIRNDIANSNLDLNDVDVVFTGVNGNPANDQYYNHIFSHLPLVRYKNVFGENFTSSAFGIYAAAHCLKKGYVPEFMYYARQPQLPQPIKKILVVNQRGGMDYSLIKMEV